MCFPPFCEPATHFLGCFSLKHGAATVLVVNAAYGLCMVVIHAILLGKLGEYEEDSHHERGEHAFGEHRWMRDLVDLDFSWGHRLLGFDDASCLFAGLVYGIVIIVACGYMFNEVHNGGSKLAMTSRWFVAFMNLEIFLYVTLVLVKLPKLCKLQDRYLPQLEMKCELQRFLYLNRVVVILIIAGVCCWIFSSLSYFLMFGFNTPIDHPDHARMLDLHEQQLAAQRQQSKAPPSNASLQRGGAPPSTRQSLVGAPVSTVRGSMAHGSVHPSLPVPRTSMRPGSVAGSMRGAPSRTSYTIPRASSSMVTSASDYSHPETQSLIKPPVAIY